MHDMKAPAVNWAAGDPGAAALIGVGLRPM
jgi:hypothetical protein